MLDRFRASSSLIALAIASVGVLSACEQGKPQDPLAKVSSALSSLSVGDVAVTCMFTQNDAIQITPLVAIDVGTDLKYTDREANAAGMFNTGENADVVIPINSANDASTTVAAGTSLFFTESGLGNGTEQVFLYQGTLATTYNLIWGLQVSPAPTDGGTESVPGWADVRDDANDLSERPTVLVGASVGLFSGAATGFAYDSTKGTSGTKAQLQALISDPANWIQVAPMQANCPGNFTVIPDATDAGGGTDSAGQGGAGGSDGGAAGMTGTADGAAGADGSVADTGAGGSTDGSVVDTGAGGATDAPVDTGAGGAGGSGAGGAGGASTDSGTDVKTDTGSTDTGTGTDAKTDTGTTTDAKTDTGTTTDAKADTGTTADAKTDTGSKADTGVDSGKTTSSSSGCSCSTASSGQSLSASVSLLALAGIVMTARRRRRR